MWRPYPGEPQGKSRYAGDVVWPVFVLWTIQEWAQWDEHAKRWLAQHRDPRS